MKINKKECRKYAALGPKIPRSSGLLLVRQITYIIRTTVRIIDHHRILILYFYHKEHLLRGENRPQWIMFHSKDDYITLEMKEDGTTAWRTSSLENLGDRRVCPGCAFYTLKDDERVRDYFGEQGRSGFSVLYSVQVDILLKRASMREHKRELAIVARMKAVSAPPRGIDTWLLHEVMPAYFFYDYKKNKKVVKGVCSSCGKEVEMTGARHNAKSVCPHCKR